MNRFEPHLFVTHPDGSLETYQLSEQSVTLGRSPSAGISFVNAEDLLPEQLLLAARKEGCWISVAEGSRVAVTIKDKEFNGGILAWGSELRVGPLALRFSNHRPAPPPTKSQRILHWVINASVIAAIWALISPSEHSPPELPDRKPPALFSGLSVPCKYRGTAAAYEAREAEYRADLRAETYAFNTQDGIKAVADYMLSESCYENVGKHREAGHVRSARQALVARVEDDYKLHQAALQRASRDKRTQEMLEEVRATYAFVAHLRDPYLMELRRFEVQTIDFMKKEAEEKDPLTSMARKFGLEAFEEMIREKTGVKRQGWNSKW